MAYWFRIKFDIQQTQSLYLARKKALNYLTKDNGAPGLGSATANQLWLETNGPNANVLHIRIERCGNVRALHIRGPPDCCILYQFFNFKATSSPAVRSNENPTFNSEAVFRVTMSQELEAYLLGEKLDIYVTDSRDENQRHFLGVCRLQLSELLAHPLMERQAKLLTDEGQENGYLIYSAFWERPYRTRGRPAQATPPRSAVYSARNRRASLTPRGSLVGIAHSARLKPFEIDDSSYRGDVRPPTRDAQSGNMSEHNGHQPVPPPRKITSGRSSGLNISRSDAKDRPLASQKGNDYFSPPSTSTKRSAENGIGKETKSDVILAVGKDRSRRMEDLISPVDRERRTFSSMDRGVPVKRSSNPENERSAVQRDRNLSGDYERSADQLVAAKLSDSSKLFRRNISDPVVGILKGTEPEKVRRFTVGHPLPAVLNSQIIQAELHHNTENRFSGKIPKKDGVSKEMLSARRKNSEKQGSRISLQSPMNLPKDTIAITVHSLYFTEGAPILAEPLRGEIFVIFDFLDQEHESLLAVVKPTLQNKELVFEFRKEFPLDRTSHAMARKLVENMLEEDSSGRIHFSVYFQPDDEDRDCELIGVAALSINRLLVKTQDAFGVELKLMNPSEKGQVVGYVKVTVQAIDVLLDMKKQQSQDT